MAISFLCSIRSSVWSSAISWAPSSIRRKARSDFPLPGGPAMRTPLSSMETQEALRSIQKVLAASTNRIKQAFLHFFADLDQLGIRAIRIFCFHAADQLG